MNETNILKLLEAMAEIVDADGLWYEKLKRIQEEATNHGERYETALEEFLAWGEPPSK